MLIAEASAEIINVKLDMNAIFQYSNSNRFLFKKRLEYKVDHVIGISLKNKGICMLA